MQQAREKFMSLRKSTRIDIATVVEEVGHVFFFFFFLGFFFLNFFFFFFVFLFFFFFILF